MTQANATASGLAIPNLRAARTQQLQQQLLKLLAVGGLTAGGLGVLGRSIGGVTTTVRQQLQPHTTYTPDAPLVVKVPGEEEKQAQVGDQLYGNVGSFLRGDFARHPMELPYALPAVFGVTGAAAMGGWHMTDKILDKLRQHQLNSEMSRVKQRYTKALTPQPEEEKSASSDALDSMYECWREKSAETGAATSSWSNADNALGPVGGLLGALGIGALGAGGTSAALGYAMARRRAANSVVGRARRSFENAVQQQRPPAIMAVPRVGEEDDTLV